MDKKGMEQFEHYADIVSAARKALITKDASDLQKLLEKPDAMKREFVKRITSVEEAKQILEEAKCMQNTEKLKQKLRASDLHRKRRRILLWFSSAAAVVALAVGCLYWFQPTIPTPTLPMQAANPSRTYTVPTLITHKPLANAPNNLEIVQVNREEAAQASIVTGQNQPDSVFIQTLIIPSGYIYSLDLPDGTKVTLNANSRFSYPESFTENTRKVYLEGEGYFQVKKSNKPFLVKSHCGDVRVYGTTFNVYQRQENMETLLLEGEVGVSLAAHPEIRLTPGEMMSYERNKHTPQVQKVDLEKYLGWLKGEFYYDEMPIKRVLADLSDWYGVEFHYEPTLENLKISFKLEKNTENIDDIMSFISVLLNKKITKQGERRYIIENRPIQ